MKLPTRPIRERFDDLIHGHGLGTAEDNDQPQHLDADRIPYRVSSWRYLPSVLNASDVGPDDVFLDLGAGKGRVLYQAARYPFRRVIGVEISPLLTVVARQNLARKRRSLRCREIELITMDAAEYEIPDDVTVVYLYHPSPVKPSPRWSNASPRHWIEGHAKCVSYTRGRRTKRSC